MSATELQLLLTAKDTASGVIRGLAGALVGELGGALSEAAQAAAEDEASVARLRAAVDAAGGSFEAWTPAIQSAIANGQSLAFTDDQTRDALTRLTATTGSTTTAIQLLGIAQDLARGKNIDLATASEIVGKVQEGNTSILKRYGIELGANATAQEALAALQQKFGGQAEAYGTSTAGSIAKVKDQISEWRESIGAALGPAGMYIALLPQMGAGIGAVGGAIGFLMPKFGGLITFITSTAIPAAVELIVALAPILIPLAAIALAVLLLKVAWENNWGDIQGKVEAVVGFLTGLFNNFRDFFIGVWNALPGPVQAAIGFITAPIRGLFDLIQNVFNALGNLSSFASGIIGNIGSFFGGLRLPGFAEGGVVPGPIGAPMLAVVHGGETVIPTGGSGGGGVTLVFNGPIYGMDDFKRQVAAAIRDTRLLGGLRGVPA